MTTKLACPWFRDVLELGLWVKMLAIELDPIKLGPDFHTAAHITHTEVP